MLKVILFYIAIASVLAMPKEKDVVVLPSNFLEKVQNKIQKCEAETKPPPDTFKNMLKGYVENEAAFNFMYCYLVDAGFIEKNGHFIIDKLLSITQDSMKEKVKNTFEDCNKASGEDNLATFRLMIDCYRDNSPIIYTM